MIQANLVNLAKDDDNHVSLKNSNDDDDWTSFLWKDEDDEDEVVVMRKAGKKPKTNLPGSFTELMTKILLRIKAKMKQLARMFFMAHKEKSDFDSVKDHEYGNNISDAFYFLVQNAELSPQSKSPRSKSPHTRRPPK